MTAAGKFLGTDPKPLMPLFPPSVTQILLSRGVDMHQPASQLIVACLAAPGCPSQGCGWGKSGQAADL